MQNAEVSQIQYFGGHPSSFIRRNYEKFQVARIVVPWPLIDPTWNSPPNNSTLSRMLSNPNPFSTFCTSKPCPLSWILNPAHPRLKKG